MYHGKGGLVRKPRCGIPGKQSQQEGPLGSQRSHLHETIRSGFVFEQPAVLDVYVS
jgi:hypothetical protein